MAFGGTPVATSLGTRVALLTGATLANNTTGTVGAAGSGEDFELPSSFPTLDGNEDIRFDHAADPAGGTPVFSYSYAAGVWTIKNLDAANASGVLRGIIQSFHSTVR